MKRAIHWFRRDLRVTDNTALSEATRRAERVLPLFILDEDILAAPDMGAARISFLLDSLRDLARQLGELGYPLTVRRGRALEELERFCRETQAEAVFCNRDYEPHCQQRDQRVFRLFNRMGIGFELSKDAVVWEERDLLTRAGAPYTVFTPYAKAWRAKPIAPPRPRPQPSARPTPTPPDSTPIPATSAALGYPLHQTVARGGEAEGQKLLADFASGGLLRYGERRDFPAVVGTSNLSPHLHFGTVGVRTVLAETQRARRIATAQEGQQIDVFVNELIWREFYIQIMTNFPHVLNGCFRPEYDALAWSRQESHFQAWCAGQTGFPIVDAALRCLNATGWMHNRLRMIVSMFLAKDLLLPWQWGERYFMRMLVDGDHAANNGGWQWSAGTGTDAAPYFRIFNPTAQGERFDPQGEFTRRWVPELAGLAGANIHQPWKTPMLAAKYPRPIVEHARQRDRCLALFQAVRKNANPPSPPIL